MNETKLILKYGTLFFNRVMLFLYIITLVWIFIWIAFFYSLWEFLLKMFISSFLRSNKFESINAIHTQLNDQAKKNCTKHIYKIHRLNQTTTLCKVNLNNLRLFARSLSHSFLNEIPNESKRKIDHIRHCWAQAIWIAWKINEFVNLFIFILLFHLKNPWTILMNKYGVSLFLDETQFHWKFFLEGEWSRKKNGKNTSNSNRNRNNSKIIYNTNCM